MSTIIAKTISRAVLITALLFSIYLLLNGANYPGGGFNGGVLFVCAIVLVYVTYGARYINNKLRPNWLAWATYGLLFASITAIAPMIVGHNYLRSAFDIRYVSLYDIHIGTVEVLSAMFFDFGIYFAVIGSLLFILTKISADEVVEHGDNYPPDRADQIGEVEDYSLKPKAPPKIETPAEESK
jgi:multisubunit Na+/H+ antiporter MnhB subunit